MSEVQIQKGCILIYRVYDVAEEVNLSRVEALLKSENNKTRLRFRRNSRQAVIMRNAPVTLTLGESDLVLVDQTLRIETFAKMWDYGVISVCFQVTIEPGMNWAQLIELAARIERDTAVDDSARGRAQELVNLVRPALRDPHDWHEFEDYMIFFFEEVSGINKAGELLDRVDVAALIVAENTVTLSDRAKKSILEGTFQYSENDLAVIDWNSAIVIEPSGLREVPEVLEFTITHMMEMRYYDALLDQRLATIYDSIEESRSRFFSNRFTTLSREASARYIEFSEFIERVDNSLKVVGDFYLARIFRAAGEKFRIPEWEANVSRKINILSNLSELLQGEVNVNRSLWLEVTIVVLILFELATTFVKVRGH
jgi:hypothetical protein